MFKLNTIEEAIEDIKAGKLIIVVDDEDRENEGDFIAASELITPDKINFMATHGRGLICCAVTEQRCKDLDLDLMVAGNTALHATPFTVSIDLLGNGCSTGISASDRAKTILAITDSNTKPADFGRPGHIFPLRARNRGVLRRAGHTEAAVDLARLAGLYPSGVLVEIMNEDGTMARLPQLMEVAEKFDMKIISVAALIKYLLKRESLIEKGDEVNMPTDYGDFRLIPFRQKSNGLEHIALIKGEWKEEEPILVRVHSSCMTGDIFGSKRCECGEQLHKAMQAI
ncbi:MAG: 3,4-dihydroxy-2-butanone-4-phosphate synthase, partial [Bacteroidales bacterium]